MPRRPRLDDPDSWHHVVNRGIAKRPLFESRSDIRYFLALLARQVRQGRIEVHAYCVMTTHFHLLVRSPCGQLSEAMRRLQNGHSRRFNRSRKRDGALIRGRFFSRRVDSDAHRRAVVRYIDANPVKAGIVNASGVFEFGSAAAFLRGRGSPWLSRSWIEAAACTFSHARHYDAMAYLRAFPSEDSSDLATTCELIEARLASRMPSGANEDLLGAAATDVRTWMEWKRRIADGQSPGLPICVPNTLRAMIEAELATPAGNAVSKEWSATFEVPWIGLLHDVCGRSWREIARLQNCSASQVRKAHQLHRRLLRDNPVYAERVRRILGAS